MSARRILLINPWIIDFAAYDFRHRPLGLLTLAAALRNAGFGIDYIDCIDRAHPSLREAKMRSKADGTGKYLKTPLPLPLQLSFVKRNYGRYGIPVEAFESDLDRISPPDAVIVTSSMTYWYPGVFEVIGRIKRRWPDVPIALGGRYATLCADHAREFSGSNFVIEGPWECASGIISEIIGASFDAPSSFSDAPIPAHDLVANRESASISLTRGCPFRCSYCVSGVLSPRFEIRGAESAATEIELLVELGARHIAFCDDALLAESDRLLAPLLRHVIDRKYNLNFYTPNAIHAAYVTEELAGLMKLSGFAQVRLGYESSDAGFLKSTGGKVTTENFECAARILRSAGFRPPALGAYILLGHPDQTEESIRDAISRAAELGLEPVLADYSPIPGSRDYETAVKSFKYSPDRDPLLQNSSIVMYQHPSIGIDGFRRLTLAAMEERKRLLG
jgi:radical SAM superfamily enzyme YgiQ (UPF0313 family)